MVYGTYNYSYWGESKPTTITGGPHIVSMRGYDIMSSIPIGSMYAILPPMLAYNSIYNHIYIYVPYMDPMGLW